MWGGGYYQVHILVVQGVAFCSIIETMCLLHKQETMTSFVYCSIIHKQVFVYCSIMLNKQKLETWL